MDTTPCTALSLRNLQLLLKREATENKILEEELKKAEKEIKYGFQYQQFLLKMLYYFRMLSINNKKVNANKLNSILQDINQKNPPQLSFDKDNQCMSDFILPLFRFILDNLESFSQFCVHYIHLNPDLIDELTYSLIPGLFQYLWCEESMNSFISFIKNVFKIDKRIGYKLSRVAFMNPEFLSFLDIVFSDSQDQLTEVFNTINNVSQNKNKIQDFTNKFIQSFQDNIEFCPKFIRELIEIADFSDNFINEAFLQQFFASLVHNELFLPSSKQNLQIISRLAALDDFTKLSNILRQSDSASLLMLNTGNFIYQVVPELNWCILFSNDDLSMIFDILKRARGKFNQIHQKYLELISNFEHKYSEILNGDNFHVFSFNYLMNGEQSQIQLSSDDTMESTLRSILCDINVIPLATNSINNPKISKILSSQIQLSRSDFQIALQIKIDSFKKSHKRLKEEGIQYDFSSIVELLQKKYDERQLTKSKFFSNRNYAKKRIIVSNTILKSQADTTRSSFLANIIDSWVEDAKPFNGISEQHMQFDNTYLSQIFSKWSQWEKFQNYDFSVDFGLIHNQIFSYVSFIKFKEKNQKYVNEDNIISQCISTFLQNIIKENINKFTKPAFMNITIMDDISKLIKSVYTKHTPYTKIKVLPRIYDELNKIFKALEQSNTTEEKINTLANHQSFFIATLSSFHPNDIQSTTQYMKTFLLYDKIEEHTQILSDGKVSYVLSLFEHCAEYLIRFHKMVS